MVKKPFGILPGGEQATLYTISAGGLTAQISDFGATLVGLYVPDSRGVAEDIVLGFDDANGYRNSTTYFGATVGRNANRIRDARFTLRGNPVQLPANDNGNNHHSGPDSYAFRLWQVVRWEENEIVFSLHSPHGDQGFPGNAQIRVTYTLEENALCIAYWAVSDRDTVFNLTNHSYFNLSGHHRPELAMGQTLRLNATYFTPSDSQSIPTGEKRSVTDTPMDFRTPKAIERDIDRDYECLHLQGGYDHNFCLDGSLAAVLCDPVSGRTMEVTTDCPGLHLYSGNFLQEERGKAGVVYRRRSGVALETQYYPNAVNIPQWPQPVVEAGETYRSQTKYTFL